VARYSIPAPKGDSTFDDKAPNGWFGTWTGSTPDGADLHRDATKEKGDSAKFADAWKTGGGGVWMTPAYDKESNTIFVAVGNPSPDLDGSVRPGDNLYTDCIVAIDASNGKTKWYYQTVPHDVWDLDAVSPPAIATVGGQRSWAHAGKTGWVYARRGHGQAGPPERCLRPAGEHVRAPQRQGHPHAARRQRRR
jgi:glucose dehydrogenase